MGSLPIKKRYENINSVSCKEVYYNVKTRVHGNGLTEIRIYEKPIKVCVGKAEAKLKYKKIDYGIVENCAFDENIEFRYVADIEGFKHGVDKKAREAISLSKSVKRTRDKVFDYANSVIWEWFVTFTFDENKVDRTDFVQVSRKMTVWLSNMRLKHCPNLQYVLVPEKHKDGSWHFHGIFANCKELDFVEAINQKKLYNGKPNKYYGQPLIRDGMQVYDMKKFRLGWSDCTKVRDTKKVANYILKYITKEMVVDTPNRKRYWNSKNLTPVKEYNDFTDIEHESFATSKIVECLKKNPDTYCHTVEVQHGDFTNKITYIYC